MWEGQVRADGLLRGARNERIRQMLALKNTNWNLDALLDLHCGLLDHAHDVREAAMESLLNLAAREPVPVTVTPARLLAYYMSTFTIASGIDVAVVQCLAGARTTEADGLLIDLLESGRGSNDQFRRWLEILGAADRGEILRRIRADKFSAGRKKILNGLMRQ